VEGFNIVFVVCSNKSGGKIRYNRRIDSRLNSFYFCCFWPFLPRRADILKDEEEEMFLPFYLQSSSTCSSSSFSSPSFFRTSGCGIKPLKASIRLSPPPPVSVE
jgi:hypothetical protein